MLLRVREGTLRPLRPLGFDFHRGRGVSSPSNTHKASHTPSTLFAHLLFLYCHGRSLKAIGKAHEKMMRGQFGFEIFQLYTIWAILLIEGLTPDFIGIFRIII